MKQKRLLLPIVLKRVLKNMSMSYCLMKLFVADYKRYRNAAFSFYGNDTYDNLRAELTLHYHSLEKGLSNNNIRLGFGKEVLTSLFGVIDRYIYKTYPMTDIRFQAALSAIEQYITYHKTEKHDVKWVEDRYKRLSIAANEALAGAYLLSVNELPDFRNVDFKTLADNRHSVRTFATGKVQLGEIHEAIQIALKAPSACNRQPCKTYVIQNQEIVNKVARLQRGLAADLDTLLVITANNRYYGGPKERNAAYIDGGLFAMSLIYALEYVGIASCALNASFDVETEKEIKNVINAKPEEAFILIIAVGNYPQKFKVTRSRRDPLGGCIINFT